MPCPAMIVGKQASKYPFPWIVRSLGCDRLRSIRARECDCRSRKKNG